MRVNVARKMSAQPPPATTQRRRPLLITIGTRGDIQPLVPLALAMRRAGWSPLFASQPHHCTLVLEHGLEFASIFDDEADWRFCSNYDDHLTHFEEWNRFYTKHLGAIRRRLKALVEAHEADHGAPAARQLLPRSPGKP